MEIHKFQIAKVQLDDAILCFIEEKYISSLTLAGASEEILGKLSERYCDKKSSYNSLMDLLENKLPNKKVKINLSRNALKHADNKNEDEIEFFPEVEAMIMILRAINNYYNFSESAQYKLPSIDIFLEKVSSHELVNNQNLKFYFL